MSFISTLSTVLLDGFAYAMVLFLISAGLSLTMGLMRFANLAHGVFAMIGGYITVAAMLHFDVPFLGALVLAFVLVALGSIVFERLLYRPLYGAPELDQVLMTFGLIFISIAVMTYLAGPFPQPIKVPSYLSGRIDIGFRDYPAYRLFLLAVGVVLSILLWLGIDRTLFGAKIRAAVDNPRIARALGIKVDRLFMFAFALGSGLAALGGAIGSELLPISPTYSLEHLIIVLIVVSIGGMGSLKGTFVAAVIIGIVDTAGKYFVPEIGGFLIYTLTIVILLWRPEGLFGKELPGKSIFGDVRPVVLSERWHIAEVLPWALAIIAFFVFDKQMALATQILIAILFALSLDLVMGYAGILTLGHAALFGTGAYAAGILSARLGLNDPLFGLLVGGSAGAVLALVSGSILLRTRGLTLLMVTLAVTLLIHEVASRMSWLTGGDDGLQGVTRGELFGFIKFDFLGKTMYLYALAVLFCVFVFARCLARSQFGLALRGIRENPHRMKSLGSAVHSRLVVVYVVAGAMAGIAGALYSQANRIVALDALSFERSGFVVVMLVLGGLGHIYGAFVGAFVYILLEHTIAENSPEFWYLWMGLFLVFRSIILQRGISGLAQGALEFLRDRARSTQANARSEGA